ncbi:glycosyltransferase family 2 protein [Geobacter pickeringii]|uniref:Glycosyl transferase family 2 n=1 Tax=Geobacter pickeringii TaxID=345632 RepID=A0A0B5BAG3_9BACT|nr:glycosyltransferase family 2 protein [Geobacter pickeringii]AJE03713.1 glycosyl transferase family 2 [Geobacter pickeringii]
MKITATIIAKNEEKNISDCLASLDWADEIVVVDSGSTDRTPEICRNHPEVRYFEHEWEGFGKQKNFAADQAVNDWVFNIDADERVSPALRDSILSADFASYDGFRVTRENYFGRRWIRRCGWYPDHNLRLYNRTRCRFAERLVHESVECPGPVGTLQGNLIHFTYEGIGDYVARMDRYSTLAAEEIVKSGRRPGVLSVVFRPCFTFFKMYVLRMGVLEGRTGLLLSLLYAVYTFLKYAKSVELIEERRR